ncbi:MAG: protein kinase [Deltaproteobacteria bacterium]|nr:protein kinase [Deltaproteobacteria bacterium]
MSAAGPQPTQPTVFGRYELLELLAKGGMAEVFRARLATAAGAEKHLCIKRILPALSSNSDFMSLFVQEAKIALPLTHGNITQVFDFGEVEGVYFLAMEYIRGQNLHQVLRRVAEGGQRLDVPAVLFIAAEVCKGLQYAHAYTDATGTNRAVIHRDVTPHNVLISYNGEVKLTDFGIALAATKAGTADGVVRGKPCYLAPEQLDGEPAAPRGDIYSLGALLYEALSGRRPYDGESEAEILERARTDEVKPPSHYNPEVDFALDQIVLKAMARSPAERHQRAGDLQVALTQYLHGRWPDYTAEKLGHVMRDLFAWELAQAGPSSDALRDRLLLQLAKAGIKVDAATASTEDLLSMGTVAISAAKAATRPKRERHAWPWVAGALAAAVALGIAVWVGVFGEPHGGATLTGREPSTPPVAPPTEHLVPPSLKAEEGGATAAPEAPPEAREPKDPAPHRRAGRGTAPARGEEVAALNCNSWPWSVVYLNGRRLRGNTPIYGVKVAPGRHRLKFVNPELGLSREVTVDVEAGNTKTVAVSLQQ